MVLPKLLNGFLLQTMDFIRFCRGFHAKEVETKEFTWSYIERKGRHEDKMMITNNNEVNYDNNVPTTTHKVVFLHGFSSIKESWLRIASRLDKKYSILIPDLPGQGRTTPLDPTMSYTVLDQAKRLNEFVDCVFDEHEKFHLIGCSMGGMIAGVYAGMFPERVESLTMVCPAGVTMPSKSDAMSLLEETGKNVLLAHTTDDLLELPAFLSYNPTPFPRMIASLFASERKRQLPLLEKLVDDLLEHPTILEDYLHKIEAKTLVMWGKNDRVLDVSCVEIVEEKLGAPKEVMILDECGHILQHEKHRECSQAIIDFLNQTPANHQLDTIEALVA